MIIAEDYTAPLHVWVLSGLALVLPVVAMVWVTRWFSRRRAESVKQFGVAHGLTYTARDDSVLHDFSGWPFNLGTRRRAYRVLRGTYRDRYSTCFLYGYTKARFGRWIGSVSRLAGSTAAPTKAGTDIFGGLDPPSLRPRPSGAPASPA